MYVSRYKATGIIDQMAIDQYADRLYLVLSGLSWPGFINLKTHGSLYQ
ncbi:hypothetical protein [Nitrosomonas marina]|uniref:Uncharacterized protein n=1 Tax=Nitrosomonas marina TaxID=917 RepID=A0A1H8C839_9PROT|nr:hypothetical protein [Nitrosomonas marina]SEM90428.1 hypothetical protein SAMN05216325_10424 [Nitrosomonas marina]